MYTSDSESPCNISFSFFVKVSFPGKFHPPRRVKMGIGISQEALKDAGAEAVLSSKFPILNDFGICREDSENDDFESTADMNSIDKKDLDIP